MVSVDQNNKACVEFSMSGTLGDSFVVFCKLAGYYKRTNSTVKLYRYSENPEFDNPISGFFSTVPYISYMTPSYLIKWSDNMLSDCNKMTAPHISSIWNGKNFPYFPDDPENVIFEPYPDVSLPPLDFGNDNRFKVGIQLNTGKVGGNFKGFSLRWLAQIRDYLPQDKFALYLLGTGGNYNLGKIEEFCSAHKINNLIGKTDIVQWMSYIKAMDFFITPEGFAAFFAMSQKVHSLVFYTDYQVLGRIHPLWRRENIILSAGFESFLEKIKNAISRTILSRNQLLSPIRPSQVYSLIWNMISY